MEVLLIMQVSVPLSATFPQQMTVSGPVIAQVLKPVKSAVQETRQ